MNRHVFRVQNLCSEGREQPERGIHQGSATNATEARAAESVISTGGTLQDRKGDKTKTRGKVIKRPKAGCQLRATLQMTR